MKQQFLAKVASIMALVANAIFLTYLVVFATAQPSGPLIAAVAFEVVFFAAMIGYRLLRSRTQSAKLASAAMLSLENHSKLFRTARNVFGYAGIVLSSAVCLFLLVDLSAFLCANSGNRQAAIMLYRVVAPPAVLGLHPAFSLEMLAGACVQSDKLAKAEQLDFTLADIRRSIVGEKHELMAAIDCDLGDLYKRWGKSDEAEKHYRKSILLSQEIHYRLGWGHPLTRLAILLRDEQKYEPAEQAFKAALTIRRKLFGNKSLKVAETLKEYSMLKLEQGHVAEASRLEKEADGITNGVPKKPIDQLSGLAPLVVMCLSFLIFSQRDRLLIMVAACLEEKHSAPKVVAVSSADSRCKPRSNES